MYMYMYMTVKDGRLIHIHVDITVSFRTQYSRAVTRYSARSWWKNWTGTVTNEILFIEAGRINDCHCAIQRHSQKRHDDEHQRGRDLDERVDSILTYCTCTCTCTGCTCML